MVLCYSSAKQVLRLEDNKHLCNEYRGVIKDFKFKVLFFELEESRGYQSNYQKKFKGYIIIYKNVENYKEYKEVINNYKQQNNISYLSDYDINKTLKVNIDILGFTSKKNYESMKQDIIKELKEV